MPGVGKVGRLILLLALCMPAAVHLSRRSALAGEPVSLSGLVMRVCHQGPVSRGTHRRSQPSPCEPLNALMEQGRGDSSSGTVRPSLIVAAAFALPQFRPLYRAAHYSGPGPDPAFLCSFLI